MSCSNLSFPRGSLPVGKDYAPLIALTGRRFEPEDRQLKAVLFPGLVMPRLMQFTENRSPKRTTGPGSGIEPRRPQKQFTSDR
jgi:hypothetical protein